MAVTRDDVLHIAELARLGVDAARVDELTKELSAILGHMDVLSQVDTTAVRPTNRRPSFHRFSMYAAFQARSIAASRVSRIASPIVSMAKLSCSSEITNGGASSRMSSSSGLMRRPCRCASSATS